MADPIKPVFKQGCLLCQPVLPTTGSLQVSLYILLCAYIGRALWLSLESKNQLAASYNSVPKSWKSCRIINHFGMYTIIEPACSHVPWRVCILLVLWRYPYTCTPERLCGICGPQMAPEAISEHNIVLHYVKTPFQRVQAPKPSYSSCVLMHTHQWTQAPKPSYSSCVLMHTHQWTQMPFMSPNLNSPFQNSRPTTVSYQGNQNHHLATCNKSSKPIFEIGSTNDFH